MKLRQGDTIRVGGRLGRVSLDEDGDIVYEHRRDAGTTQHPDAEFVDDYSRKDGGFIDYIWKAPILKLIVFIGGIFLCIPSWCIVRLFKELVI